MFTKNLNEEPDESNVVENWCKERITVDNNTVYNNINILNLDYDKHLYAFEIYILRE